jgi:hypothetical protein
LTIKLPDFCSNKTIEIQAYIEDEVIGRHSIILGIQIIQQLGLIFDFLRGMVTKTLAKQTKDIHVSQTK